MRKIDRWIRVLVLTLTVCSSFAAGAQDLRQQVDSYLAERVRKDGIPGLAASVVVGHQPFYTGSFGVRKLGATDKVTPDTVFHFASVSKPFVATAVMQLVERGKMKLDDPITKYIPEFRLQDPVDGSQRKDLYKEITIKQLLNHTSGMPDVQDYHWDKPEYDAGSAERFVKEMAKDHLLFPPGSGYIYSNKSFDALAVAIARASGMSFEDFVKANILRPAGMKNSSFIYPEISESLRVSGHVGNPAKVSSVYPYNRRHAPSSTLNSNIEDMTRWMLINLRRGELDGKRILEPQSFSHLWTFTTGSTRNGGRAKVGLSWFLKEHRGRRAVFHGGGDTGFAAFLLILPDEGVGIVIGTNWQETDREKMAYDILDMILASPLMP